jgi:chromosomal replication initiator protein
LKDANELWRECAARIRAQVSDAVWRSTFHDVTARPSGSGGLVLGVPSGIAKERIESRYMDLLRAALGGSGSAPAVVIEVDPALPGDQLNLLDLELDATPAPSIDAASFARSADPLEAPVPRDGDIAQSLNPRYSFGSFVTGTSNRFAHAAALSVAETPAKSYNPLFIYGDAGLGKTHLLHAIGHYVRENYPTFTVRYVSTETFLNQFVDAIRTNDRHNFKRRYREIDVLLVDDIQFMEGKEGLQEEFFHTFNTLHQGLRQIVISSDRPPDAMSTLEDRLRSRFKMGLITDIQPPDIETRLAILRKKADADSVPVPAEVLEFIAAHITDNIRELEGALIRVCAFASLTNETLSIELARQILSDILTEPQPRLITAQLILDETSRQFGFSIEEIQGGSRRRPLVTARQIAMYVTRQLTELSYPAIAREFGGRDHTTVIHAVDKISALMSERRQIYDQVTELIQRIKNGDERAIA